MTSRGMSCPPSRTPGGYAFDGLLGCRQPEVEQRHEVAFGMGLFDESYVRTGGQRGFKCEVGSFRQQVVHALEHQPACFNRHAAGVERRESPGYLVGIDEFATAEHLRQYGVGRGGFSRAVASGYDVEMRHIVGAKIGIAAGFPKRGLSEAAAEPDAFRRPVCQRRRIVENYVKTSPARRGFRNGIG